MIDAPYLDARNIVRAASRGEISPREAEWGLVDVLGEAGQDIDPSAADLIDTALALLGEWDRGDRAIEDLLTALASNLREDSHEFDVPVQIESGAVADASSVGLLHDSSPSLDTVRDNQLVGELLGIGLGVKAA